jgi:flagellar motor switch protein FliG
MAELKRGKASTSESPKRRHADASQLSGPAKAALWLLSIEEDSAVEILSHLEEDDVRRVRDAARALGHITPAQLAAIHEEFYRRASQSAVHIRGSVAYLTRLTSRAFGKERTTDLFSRQEEPRREGAKLDTADVDVLASLLAKEHPQVVAAVIAHLSPARSVEIAKRLSEDLRQDVVARIAQMGEVPQAALARVESILAAGLPMTADGESKIDGVRMAALLLNQLDHDDAEAMLTAIGDENVDVASSIRHAMFRFEDLVSLDRRGFQTLLKEIQADQLILALRMSSNEIKSKVFSCLSKRAAEMLKEDLEIMGPVRVADVEQAQQAIVDIAMQLRSYGRLAIAGQGGDEYV